MKTRAILLAAGRAKRFGSLKQFLLIDGKPLLWYSLQTLLNSSVDSIYLVLPEEKCNLLPNFSDDRISIISGGSERSISTFNAIKKINENETDAILIHDAARPLLPLALVNNLCSEIRKYDGLSTAISVSDALVQKNTFKSVDRNDLLALQTPQIFRSSVIRSAFAHFFEQPDLKFPNSEFELVRQRIPQAKLGTIPGNRNNIKVTTPEDFAFVQRMISPQ